MREEGFATRHLFIFLLIAFLLATTVAAVAIGGGWELLRTNTNTASTSSFSGLEIVTSNGSQELAMLRGCVTDQIIKRNSSGAWACASDVSSSATGAGVVILDLADDGANESASIGEIATTGDTNSIFTEPTADKLLIALGNDWPKADLADALAANPTDCGANQFANAIVASGNLTCAQPAFSDLSGAATDAQVPNTITIDLAAAATALAANGSNCAAGSYPLGVTAAGASESCTVAFNQTIEDEGTGLTQRTNVNFTGAGVSCADSGGKTVCTISGGGSANSFETIDAPSGTDPVADSASDTLQLLAGTNITITGDSGADSITIAATGSGAATFGRSLTINTPGNVVDADVELYTVKKSINILNPTTGETNKVQLEYPLAATITEVSCSVDTGTVTIQFDERARATPNTAGTDVMTSTLACDTDSQTTTSFSNASMAADVPVNLQITATSGTPTIVRIHVEATMDD